VGGVVSVRRGRDLDGLLVRSVHHDVNVSRYLCLFSYLITS
jgi:hypothetical protein